MKQADFFSLHRRSNRGAVNRLMLVAVIVIGGGAVMANYLLGRGEILSATGYTITEESVYYAGKELATADPASFRILSAERAVAVDDYHVYHQEAIAPHVDHRSFALLDRAGFYMRDASRVFYLVPGAVIQNADPTSFEPIPVGDRASEFWRDRSAVYIWGRRIAGADPRTFEALTTRGYARDRDRIYSGERVLRQADAPTFEVLFEDSRGRRSYARDRVHVFYNEQIIRGADLATFEVLKDSLFARDAHRLYYAGVANFSDIDLTNVRIGKWFVKDAVRVYLVPHDPDNPAPVFPDANPSTLASLGSNDDGRWGYASDGVHVYYYNCWRNQVQLLSGADPRTFEIVKADYRGDLRARDENARYFNEKRIE